MLAYDADAIIIGAGHNSLTAALYLQKAGLNVLIIELSNSPGGAAKTGEVTEPGLKHDLFATNIGLFLGSQVYSDFKQEFHKNGFDVVMSENPFANVFPDKKCLKVYKDSEKTYQEINNYSKNDALAWSDMISYFNHVAPHLFPLLQKPMPSIKILNQLWKIYRKLGRSETYELVQLLIKSPASFLNERYESDEVKALLSPWAFHLDFGPDVAGGATFSFLESSVDHLNGMAFSKGGVGNLINSMVNTIKSKGGKFILGKKVNKILVHKGKAVGVKTEAGKQYFAKKGVIANITPHQIIKLVDQEKLPDIYVQKAKKYRFGPGTMMIHIALDKPLVWDAGEDLSTFAYVHVGPYLEDITRTYNEVSSGYIPRSPLLVVAQQSVIDSTRTPSGKHVLWVQVRALPARPKGDAMGIITGDSWDKIKEKYCERVIDKLALYAPNIKDIIRKKYIYSPNDLEKENPNLVNGDNVGGSHHLDQNFFFRPFSGWSNYKTPINRLFITGASTWPGGGLNATSGYLTAKQFL